jgi:prevent-host-death family protein
MYIMYRIAEFRERLRDAFNEAENGELVEITRHGKTFVLSTISES